MRTPLILDDPSTPPPFAVPSTQTLYTKRLSRLVELARKDMDVFGAVVLKDQDGLSLDVADFHRVLTRFLDYCWEPESRKDPAERADGPYYCGILAPWRHGKCGPAWSPVTLADGRVVGLGDVSGTEFQAVGVDPKTWLLFPVHARVEPNGNRRVVRLVTCRGRTLDVTENHPILTPLGWRDAGDTKIGDALAVLRSWEWGHAGDRVLWDRVVEVQDLGILPTYAIETSSKTYLSGDIVSHNTMLGPIRVPLFQIGRNPNVRIRLICADDREAMLRVSAIRRYIVSQEYKWVFPTVKPALLSEWTKHQIFVARDSLGQDPTLAAAGVFNTEAGGGNDIVMLDDVATYQNMILRPAYRARVYEALTSVWLRRIDPNTRVMYVGTTWHADDPPNLLRAQKGSQWKWLIVAVSADFKRLHCRVE